MPCSPLIIAQQHRPALHIQKVRRLNLAVVDERQHKAVHGLRVDSERLISVSQQIYGLLPQVRETVSPEELRGLDRAGEAPA